MKFKHISDSHGFHNQYKLEEGIDCIIHSGDASNSSNSSVSIRELELFIDWYKSLDIKYKVYVAGNHDSAIARGLITKKHFTDAGIIYLEDEVTWVEEFCIVGSPYTPTFGNWSFMKSRQVMGAHWEKLPNEDIDILITHGPPKGVLDLTEDYDGNVLQVGDSDLLNKVIKLEPTYHLFGHIHNTGSIVNSGQFKRSDCSTIFSNGSCVTDRKFDKGLTSQGFIFEI